MDKNIAMLKNIIENAKNINACLKSLNLDYNSSFICFLYLLEDASINYREGDNYEYLIKISNYLERVFNKLSIKEKESHRKQLLVLRKIYKKQISSLLKNDKNIFEKVYLKLEILIMDKKEEKEKPIIENDELSDLLYNVLFNFKNLEYLDKLIEKNPNILNCYYNDKSIFMLVVEEYINCISNKEELVLFYERVINKFLLEETFHLTDEMRDNIIKILNNFVANKKVSSLYLKEIKKVIECLNKNENIFDVLKISKEEPVLYINDKSFGEQRENNIKNRVVFDGFIATIDDEGTKVLDDAISEIKILPNGNLMYMIHIADPLSLLPLYSDTLKEAKKRTTTIYLKDINIPMINPYFSEDKLSLIKDKKRFTKTFCVEFDKHFNLVDFKILNSIIKVSDRLSYNSLNALYTSGGQSNIEEKRLDNYDKLISSLKKMFKNAKIYEEIKEKNIVGNSKNMGSFSENLVSYSMMLVGYLTAKYFEEHGLPYVYRCHKLNQEWISLLDELSSDSKDQNIKKIVKSMKGEMPKSYYSRINDKHMGLDLPYYSHITSPLRRYMDNLNMHALNVCYFNNPSDKDLYDLQIEMDTTCDYVNMQSNTIDECISKKLIK
ncbi:MAG: RNB domain-containing ribonuclease [Bacilli bacterium]|nr:RNB domain-containing ribonuclease [Bacilli bacterium]